MRLPATPEEPPQPARALSSGTLVDSAACPVCEKPLIGRQEFCSGRCRATRSREKKAAQRADRDRRLRELLEAALELLEDTLDTLITGS